MDTEYEEEEKEKEEPDGFDNTDIPGSYDSGFFGSDSDSDSEEEFESGITRRRPSKFSFWDEEELDDE